MIEITSEEIIAYSEINHVLNNIEKEYFKKVPTQLISFFKNNSLDYGIYYDDKGNLKLSKLAKQILCYINLEYWSTEDEKQELIKQYTKNQETIDRQYDISRIFESKKHSQSTNVTQLVIKENWFQKIIKKVKRVLGKI